MQLDLGYPKVLKQFKFLQAAADTVNIRSIQLQGSNDPAGGIWSNVGSQITDITNSAGTYTYDVANDLSYRYYRVCATACWGGALKPKFYEVYFGVI